MVEHKKFKLVPVIGEKFIFQMLHHSQNVKVFPGILVVHGRWQTATVMIQGLGQMCFLFCPVNTARCELGILVPQLIFRKTNCLYQVFSEQFVVCEACGGNPASRAINLLCCKAAVRKVRCYVTVYKVAPFSFSKF